MNIFNEIVFTVVLSGMTLIALFGYVRSYNNKSINKIRIQNYKWSRRIWILIGVMCLVLLIIQTFKLSNYYELG